MGYKKLISQQTKTAIDDGLDEAKNYVSSAQQEYDTVKSKPIDAYIAAMDKCVSESSTAATNANTYATNASTAKTNATNASTSTAAITYGDTAATAAANANTQKANAVSAYNNAKTISNKKVNGTSMSSTVSSKFSTVTTNKDNASTYATNADTYAKDAYSAAMDKCVSESSTAATNANTYMNTAKTYATNASTTTSSSTAKTYYDTANTAATNAETQKTNAVSAYNNATTISNKTVNGTSMSSTVSSKLSTVTTNKNNAETYANKAREYANSAYNKYEELNAVDSALKKETLTESEFLQIVNAGRQASMTTGVVITLPNGLGTTNQWIVAGTNHDGTTGTVDLIAKNLIYNTTADAYSTNGGKWGSSQIYRDSTIRSWLTGTYITNFSTDIQNALKTMVVKTDIDGSIAATSDKIKLLSMTELGLDYYDWNHIPSTTEGAMYPLFNGTESTAQTKRIRYQSDGTTKWRYCTRSRDIADNTCVCCIGASGSSSSNTYSSTNLGIVPAIRF